MSGNAAQTGGCLCGKVRFRIARTADDVTACHCEMCRRWSGGVLFAIHCGDAVAFEDETHLVRYRSSDWAERGFCGLCGSSLFYRLIESGDVIVSAGALDDQAPLALNTEFFVDERPAYYAFANDTKQLTGKEVFAMFAPPSASFGRVESAGRQDDAPDQ